MKYKAIFFDLDGTLLPMDYATFTKGYFSELYGVAAPTGLIGAEAFTAAIWTGTKAMVRNDGRETNERVFWESFAKTTGLDGAAVDTLNGICDRFYTKEFHRARRFTGDNPLAPEAVRLAHGDGARRVVLATNPLFPRDGQLSRMSWVGLKESDFELITSYEFESFCKPNPQYYLSICERIGVSPEDCLMIGNDEREDAWAATEAGLDCFIVTDCLIPAEGFTWNGKRGTFAELVEALRSDSI